MRGNRRILLITVLSLSFVPVILVIRVISPILLIRFGFVHSAYGHMILGSELYFARKSLGLEPRRTIDLFLVDSHHANSFIVGLLHRKMTVVWRPLIRLLLQANTVLPGKSRHVIDLDAFMDPDDLLARAQPQLDFGDTNSDRADELLRELGLEPGSPFVCLHVRDTAYKTATVPGQSPIKNDYRNSDIEDFMDAAASLVDRGYTVVRMGAVVSDEMPRGIDGVIDYARSGMRSDFLDAVLAARCSFWLGSPSGANMVAVITRRPVVYIGFIPMGLATSWGSGHLYIPKKLRTADGQFLTIWDILNGEIGWPQSTDGAWSHTLTMYEERGITIIDNSPEEIRAVSEEMDDQLKGNVASRDEREIQIQEEIARIMEATRWHGKVRARLGSDFIRSHEELVAPY